MSVALMILILIMGAIIHKIYASCVTVIHFGYDELENYVEHELDELEGYGLSEAV